VKRHYNGRMRSWLQHTPMWFRLAFFFGVIWALVIAFRLFGFNDGPLLSWADARYFTAMWVIFVVAYYVGFIILRAMKKK
jgi:hypothetical protein